MHLTNESSNIVAITSPQKRPRNRAPYYWCTTLTFLAVTPAVVILFVPLTVVPAPKLGGGGGGIGE